MRRILTSRRARAAVAAEVYKAMRLQRNVSQERFAGMAGVTRTYVGRMERATVNPTIYVINRLLHAGGMSWREFGEAFDTALDEWVAREEKLSKRRS